MIISLSELNENPAKYFELAKTSMERRPYDNHI